VGQDLYVLDADAAAGAKVTRCRTTGFAAVRNVHILVTHAHLDH
jgi:hypothetical protein